ncbi:MAG: MerR family transcriptional regulator [Nocardioidaceae bacterium]
MTGTTPAPSAMHIGEVAQRTELSLRTLRHYDEVGLLRPSGRSDGGFRLYSVEDVDKLLVIRRMKPLGFTLEEMVEVMRSIEVLRSPGPTGAPAVERTDRADAARQHLAATLDQAYERRDTLRRQLAMADEFIALLGTQQA